MHLFQNGDNSFTRIQISLGTATDNAMIIKAGPRSETIDLEILLQEPIKTRPEMTLCFGPLLDAIANQASIVMRLETVEKIIVNETFRE